MNKTNNINVKSRYSIISNRLFFPENRILSSTDLYDKRCWLYARIAHNDGGFELDNQLCSIRLFIKKHKMIFVGETSETASALSIKRTGLDEVIAAAQDGKMDFLIARSIDRIIRGNFNEWVMFMDKLKSLGVMIVFINEVENNIAV